MTRRIVASILWAEHYCNVAAVRYGRLRWWLLA